MLREKRASLLGAIGKTVASGGSKLLQKSTGSAIGNIGKGALAGAALGGVKANASNANNSNLDAGQKATNIMGGMATGALTGGVLGGSFNPLKKGIGNGMVNAGNSISKNFGNVVNKSASDELDGLFIDKIALLKKSEMECPTEEEKENRLSSSSEEVVDSPNDKEKKEMRDSISAEKIKDMMDN